MSRSRQPDLSIRTFAVTTRIASMVPPQSEGWAQLIYATKGSLTVECPVREKLWYVPARRALWVPAGAVCSLKMRGSVRLRIVYLRQKSGAESAETHAINVTPLLHEAILEAVRRSVLVVEDPLAGLIVQLIGESESVPLMLPMPRDKRALLLAKLVLREPATRGTLRALAARAGASDRTLERIFARETGMGFGAWRQRLRILESMRRLLDGDSVSEAADAVGYESVSAFVVAFRATTGETPGRWVRK